MKLSLPKIIGGTVTDAIFDHSGNISELWIALDANVDGFEFDGQVNVSVGARIHVNRTAGATSK